MSSTSILLQGGTLLLHDSSDHIIPTKADLLIHNSKIVHIAPVITPLSTTHIISCVGKLITPGFIDTHRHLWQTQLKGRHANELLLDYMPTGNMAASLFSPLDIYWGELGGALESVDAGTTSIVDHAHMNYSKEHMTEGLRGMVEAGVRGFFAYAMNPRVKDWEEFSFEEDVVPEWFLHQLDQLVGEIHGDGRVQIGLAWDTWYLPKEVVSKIFEHAREWGVKLITSHYVRGPTMSTPPPTPPRSR
jgi:cytosine/adenosine deaminase-related metal-dependent hydrolase